MLDLSLVEHPNGSVTVHRPDCETVVMARELGLPIMTMYGCRSVPAGYPIGGCLVTQRHLQKGDRGPVTHSEEVS